MNKIVCVVLAAAIMLISVSGFAFSDIAADNELLTAAAAELSELEIIKGYGDGTFRPEKGITRAEMAQILRNLLPDNDNTQIAAEAAFSDLTGEHWGYEAITVMNSMGIVVGGNDGRVRPDDKVTHAEAVTMIIRMLGYENKAAENGGYPLGYISTAIETTLLNGLSLELDKAATRGEVAIMIYNMLDVPVNNDVQADEAEDESLTGSTFREIMAEYV